MEKKIILFVAIALTTFIGTVVVAQIFRARPATAQTSAKMLAGSDDNIVCQPIHGIFQ